MFNSYYREELSALRELAVEFAKLHPALAPRLSGSSSDPDVERLLQGSAFLNGLLRQKIEDELPEIVHEFIRLLWPHYLRPIPSCTTIRFRPQTKINDTIHIPAGITLNSVPVNDTPCTFKTCLPVDIHPLEITTVSPMDESSASYALRLGFSLSGVTLKQWQPTILRLHLSGEYINACDLYYLLRTSLRRIVLQTKDDKRFELPASSLIPVGFGDNEALIPYPYRSFSGYRILQEYFVFPQKFLYFDLTGLDGWTDRGDGESFDLILEFQGAPFRLPRCGREDFTLHATPAINLFHHHADPILLDQTRERMRIRPSGKNVRHYQVFSVDRVEGIVHGSVEQHEFKPFECFRADESSEPVYSLHYNESPVENGVDVLISTAYPQGAEVPLEETLSIDLTCTNGFLPEMLQKGDISVPTGDSPEFAAFENIVPPTKSVPPPVGSGELWKLISQLSLNHLSLGSAENFQALLDVYLFTNKRNQEQVLVNKRRIDGITAFASEPARLLKNGLPITGRHLNLSATVKNFASPGDLYLFGTVLDHFLGVFASLNTFTRFHIQETTTGSRMSWPPRLGERFLI